MDMFDCPATIEGGFKIYWHDGHVWLSCNQEGAALRYIDMIDMFDCPATKKGRL